MVRYLLKDNLILFQIQTNGRFQSRATECRTAMLWLICKAMCRGISFLTKTANNCNSFITIAQHRHIQGELTYSGKITFLADSFASRTRAKVGERVLSLSSGSADSLLNDSLFAPESDTALAPGCRQFTARYPGQRFVFIRHVWSDW